MWRKQREIIRETQRKGALAHRKEKELNLISFYMPSHSFPLCDKSLIISKETSRYKILLKVLKQKGSEKEEQRKAELLKVIYYH